MASPAAIVGFILGTAEIKCREQLSLLCYPERNCFVYLKLKFRLLLIRARRKLIWVTVNIAYEIMISTEIRREDARQK